MEVLVSRVVLLRSESLEEGPEVTRDVPPFVA